MPRNGVEITLWRADIELRAIECERVDWTAVLEPLDEPARFIGVVVISEVLHEAIFSAGNEQ